MSDIEIPFPSERGWKYRFFEILPGTLSWAILLAPIWLTLISVYYTSILVIAYLLLWLVKGMGLYVRGIQGWRILQEHQKIHWQKLIATLDTDATAAGHPGFPEWHWSNLERRKRNPNGIEPDEIIHAVIVATFNEAREVLEPTIEKILNSDYDKQKMIFVLAYEERGGPDVEVQALDIVKKYRGQFSHTMAVKHPENIPGEVRGKGGNITFAGHKLLEYTESKGIDPMNVLVTTLDSDNRPHPQYFACLSYVYSVCHDPLHLSFQPVPIYNNNIWDAPAPMRVIATGNSFWMIVQGLRPHMLRNFSAHAQSLAALIKTDFWSVRTIVEDGHQFWRSYFAFDGQHEVVPIFVPIFQDAVLARTYAKTIKAQFYQIRRWAWGASDIAYVAHYGYLKKNKISKVNVTMKFLRLLEGHISWATAPLILATAALIPSYINSHNYLALQLPQIASLVQRIAMAGIIITLFLSFKILPPKPERYKKRRSVWMVLQWVLLPITTITFSSFAAINSQTRLIFKRYLGGFDVTEKAVKTNEGVKTSLKEEKLN